ncbi:hypothetical protein QVD17_35815 [Tagetes erecta]|uniref:Uncharacterized protein n=1 Tax=Tagetes erecta TaxID=13708 RepID=A0AAD8JTI5_TARER|nr:hypothetical protein QVD17_35815 [Tagetes erecta]
MHTTKATTPKTLQTKLQEPRNNGGAGESSFRLLYYGSASAGSVPFMWESQPGTPKHALAESSLPPLTPPPSYQQFSQNYNSSMHKKRFGFFRAISLSSNSVSSSSSWGSNPVGKMELRRVMAEEDGGSPTSTLCFGGEFKKSYRIKKMKKAMLSFVRNGKK